MPANEHYRGYPLPSVLTGFALRQICFQIPDNDEYKRAFWDRVFQLAQPYNWQQDNYADQRNHIAAEYWEQLLYENLTRFIDDPDCGVPEANTCQTYPPTAAFIQWFPNDPVYTPDFVGAGYNSPAWYFATLPSNIAYGSQYGDVITSLDRFPPGSLPDILPASGLPRFRINVNGIGTVKAKLVNMFGGSLIQTTIDDDIGTLNFVDVSRDTISAPPETNGELMVEFNLTTPGAHHIDFIVISWVNSSIPFLHHGGGLRSVELCGFDEMPIYSPPFRFTAECGLEFYDGEAWQEVTGWTDFAPTCFQGLPGTPGEDGDTLFIRDTGDGQLQTSPDNAAWANVPNAKYLHTNADNDPLTGGLAIHPPTNQTGLSLKWATGFTLPLLELLNTDDTPMLQFLTNRRLRFFGTSGNITHDGAGNDINFSRDGANWISAIANTDNTTRIGFRVGGVESVTAMPFGRAVIGTPGFRQAALYITASNSAYNGLSVRPAASSVVDTIQALDSGGNMVARIKSDGSGEMGANDAGTNTYPDGLSIYHASTGNPVAGFGVGMRWQGKSTTTQKRDMALLRAVWETPTDATRKAQIVLEAYDTSAREVLRGGANGSGATLGVLGQSPSPQVNVGTVDCLGNAAAKAALDVLINFGFITGVINLGDAPYLTEQTPQFDRCQIASRAGRWIMQTYLQAASDVIEVGPFFANEIEAGLLRMGGYQFDILLMTAWIEDLFSEFPGNDPSTHVNAVEAYTEDFVQALYCSLTEAGCFNDASKMILLQLTQTFNVDVQFFHQWLEALLPDGIAQMVSSGLLYKCDEDIDCSEFDCDTWVVDMNFLEDDWDGAMATFGSVYAPPYRNDIGSDASAFFTTNSALHIVGATVTFYTAETVDIYFHAEGTGVYDTRTLSAGVHTEVWIGDAPIGLSVGIGSTPGDDINSIKEIRRAIISGLGTPPTP